MPYDAEFSTPTAPSFAEVITKIQLRSGSLSKKKREAPKRRQKNIEKKKDIRRGKQQKSQKKLGHFPPLQGHKRKPISSKNTCTLNSVHRNEVEDD